MTIHIALLRAINVGGTGKVPMAALRAACEAAGLRRVATYIQSGNLVFESALPAKRARAVIEKILLEKFAIERACLLRTADDLDAIVRANPFPDAAEARPERLYATFLDGAPAKGAAAALAKYEGPERTRLLGTTLYVDYVEGSGRSKLTPAFLSRTLGTEFSARNWNTVRRLLEMARSLEGEKDR
jgi:uncharacterized protein (DUF1697 family)